MQSDLNIDRTRYFVGLIASAVYVFVLGYLATRDHVCNTVAGLDCPQSPFTSIHVLLHSGLFGYLLILYRKIPKKLKWKWSLLCVVSLTFIVMVLVQRYGGLHFSISYVASLLSLFTLGLLIFDHTYQDKMTQAVKIMIAITVLLGVFVFIRVAMSAF